MPPVLCIIGESNTGKTTLLEKVIVQLTSQGIKVGTVKHTHHHFDIDKSGKDSFRHKQAGAKTAVIASNNAIGIVKDFERASIKDLIPFFDDVDLVLVEGYKRETYPKIAIIAQKTQNITELANAPKVIAVASDTGQTFDVPTFDLNDDRKIAEFILIQLLGKSFEN